MADTKSGFSAEERAAMAQRAEELRSTKGLKGAAKLARELEACADAVDALTGVDGEIARAVHRIVAEEAPHLDPKPSTGSRPTLPTARWWSSCSRPRSSTPATPR